MKSPVSEQRRRPRLAVAAVFFVLLSACKDQAGGAPKLETSLRQSIGGLKPSELRSVHAWLIKEMYERIYAQTLKNPKEIAPWYGVLNQGASIEGLYHGLILSEKYRELERGKAPIAAVRFAAQELAVLQLERSQPGPETRAQAEMNMAKVMNLSLFTLKRELGEKMLSAIEKRKGGKESFADWYAGYATRWAGEGVDFGLPERNKTDKEFHKDWVSQHSLGLVQWELLNRMHRLLNFHGGFAAQDKLKPAAKERAKP